MEKGGIIVSAVRSRWILFTYCIVVLLAAGAVFVYRLNTVPRNGPTISVSEVTQARVAESLALMGSWVFSNQREDGSLPYIYRARDEEYGEGDNVIRHMITVQGLYAAGRELSDVRFTQAAEKLEKNVLEEAYRYDEEKGYAYMIEKSGDVKLGASALAILALREKDMDAPVSLEERSLGDYLIAMQRPNGSFQTFLHNEDSDDNERFYSGEALTALAMLYRATGEKKYHDALALSFLYYRELLQREFSPQYAPWHMMAYTIFYRETGDAEYSSFVYFLADELIAGMLNADVNAQPDEGGRFFNPDKPSWGPPHSSSTGIYMEGLTYAYELALLQKDDARAQKYMGAIRLGTRSLLQVQWTENTAQGFSHPERLVGALRESVIDGDLRIDQTGHALNALSRMHALLK